jgi:hypothetical protein
LLLNSRCFLAYKNTAFEMDKPLVEFKNFYICDSN